MAELDEAGQETDFYLFPPDGLWSTDPILRKSGSSYFYYQTDHLGTPQQLIDGAGAVVHSREMRAFGEVAATGMEDRWRFPGQLESVETGLHYNYFRDYAPQLGRYVQSDPIGLGGGYNIYVYAENNGLSFIDPNGLNAWNDFLRENPGDPSLMRNPYRQRQLDDMARPRNRGRGHFAEWAGNYLCGVMRRAVERQIDEIYRNLNEQERRLSDCQIRCYKIWIVVERHADNRWCASRAVYSVTSCPFPSASANTPNNSRRFLEVDSGVLMNQPNNVCCVGVPND